MALKSILAASALALFSFLPHAQEARAELSEITIARQPSIGHLPLMIMEEQGLVEAFAKEAGIDGLKVNYVTFAGGSNMNDALLSDSIQFAAGGVPPLILLWARTAGSANEVRAVAAMNSMPLLMNTNRPEIKTIADFTEKDKIALPSVKVSVQAMVLQMAAAQLWGEENYDRLDSLTVSMSHPDGLAALLAKQEISAHFTASPAQDQALLDPDVHTVLNSYDVMGGPVTFNVVWAKSNFKEGNPVIYEAFNKALAQAVELVNTDPAQALDIYTRVAKDNSDRGMLEKILADPQVRYTTEPERIDAYLSFMRKIGTLKGQEGKPADGSDWREMFFQ